MHRKYFSLGFFQFQSQNTMPCFSNKLLTKMYNYTLPIRVPELKHSSEHSQLLFCSGMLKNAKWGTPASVLPLLRKKALEPVSSSWLSEKWLQSKAKPIFNKKSKSLNLFKKLKHKIQTFILEVTSLELKAKVSSKRTDLRRWKLLHSQTLKQISYDVRIDNF